MRFIERIAFRLGFVPKSEANRRISVVEAEREDMRARKDAAYSERQKVTVAFARIVALLGYRVGVAQHDPNDASWSKDWMTILYIDLPTGQVSWHFHDSEKHLLDGFPTYRGKWDGHNTPEKYRRLLAWALGGAQ